MQTNGIYALLSKFLLYNFLDGGAETGFPVATQPERIISIFRLKNAMQLSDCMAFSM
jgi:hypothetical protein